MLDMSFLTANFGWILLAVVLFAMLIVGYVADKTDFGHKKISKKKEIENPNKVEEINLETLKGKTLSDMVGGSKEKTETNDINEDLNAPFGDTNTTNENVDSLYTPIGSEDLNAPFGDTNTDTDIPLDFGTITPTEEVKPEETVEATVEPDLYAPIGETEVAKEEPVETTESVDELIPEVKIDSIPETEVNESLVEETPVVETSEEVIPETTEAVIEEPTFEFPEVKAEELENNIEEPTFEVSDINNEEVKSEETVETPVDPDLYAPIGEVEVPNEETAEAVSEISNPEDVTLAPMESIEEVETPSEEVVIPSVEEFPTLETPIEEVPIVDATTENEIIPEATEDVVEDVPSVETIEIPEESEKEKKKREKKEKKKHKKDKEQEESNKYTVDYDHEIVPEVITEKFNDGNNEEVSSDDDIWKF